MADDQFQASGNWWDSSSRNVRFESTGPSQSSSSNLTTIPNFTWHQPPDMDHNLKPSSSMSDSPTSSHPNQHMIMGLGLSSQPMNNWNQPSNNLLRGEKAVSDGRFRLICQENLSSGSSNFQQESGMGLSQVEWREKLLFSTDTSSIATDQYSSGESIVTTSHGLACSFQMDSSYSATNPSILQGLLGPDQASASSFNFNNRSLNFSYGSSTLNSNNDQLMAPWPKVSQFLRASPPKQTQHHGGSNSQLHFTNNATFWNASEPHHVAVKEARPSFLPSLQPPFHTPNFDAQSKVQHFFVVIL